MSLLLRWSPAVRNLLLLLAVAGVSGCRLTDVPFWGPLKPPSGALAVDRFTDVAYCDGQEGKDPRHRADLFLPRGRRDFPVVLLVHGGVWTVGDNRCWGLYSSVGEFLASQGIGAVLCNYRLSPKVKHPEHIKDVARAFAWTHAHIAEYGGNPRQIFLAGHSAGGHLVALLATDATWLSAHGLNSANIRGVIGVSGVYYIPPEAEEYTLGGRTDSALRMNQLFPLRRRSRTTLASLLPGLPFSADVYSSVFGTDSEERADASPLTHVRPGLPPFLLFSAEHDLPGLPRMAEEFHQALLQQGCASSLARIEKRNHNSIMFKAIEEKDPVGRTILEFIRWYSSTNP